MHVFGAFELDLQPGTPDNPASVRGALLRHFQRRGWTPAHHPWGFAPSHSGEGQILSLRDELGEICAGAR